MGVSSRNVEMFLEVVIFGLPKIRDGMPLLADAVTVLIWYGGTRIFICILCSFIDAFFRSPSDVMGYGRILMCRVVVVDFRHMSYCEAIITIISIDLVAVVQKKEWSISIWSE